jgi:type IV secretory system conjugative DNA transfer VirD4/TraG family protein
MKLVWCELAFPTQLDLDRLLQFTRSLAVRSRYGFLMRADPVILELDGAGGQLTWHLGSSDRDSEQVLRCLYAAIPDVRFTAADRDDSRLTTAWELRTSSRRRPLRTDVPTETATALMTAVQAAGTNERVVVQWIIGGWLYRPVVPTPRAQPTGSGLVAGIGDLVVSTEQAAAWRDKQREPLFEVVGRLSVSAASTARRRQLRRGVMGALQVLRTPGVGIERRLLPAGLFGRRLAKGVRPLLLWPGVLGASELAGAIGWPVGNPVLAGVSYSSGRQLPATPTALVPLGAKTDKRITGRVTFPGQSGLLTQSVTDSGMHTWVMGPTGSGKSWLLATMALSDMAAGHGVILVDGKGDLVRDVANRIPEHRLNDVALLEPDSTRPIGFNPLAGSTPDMAVDSIVSVLHQLYAPFWGPRSASIITNGLKTLALHGGFALTELSVLLTNERFQAQVLANIGHDDLGVTPFWQWYNSLRPSERSAAIGPVLNKIEGFTSRKLIRCIVGQSQGLNLGELLNNQRILLVDLGRGALGGENAHLFGSLLLGSLYDLIQARSRLRPSQRRQVNVYLDEFQTVMRLVDMSDALATARGLGVGFVLAHQELGQLTSTVRSAAEADCRSRIFFQLGHHDAAQIAAILGQGLAASDLEHLPAYETYQALCQGGVTTAPVSVAT